MTKFVVEITLLQHCVLEANIKEQLKELIWDSPATDFLVQTGEEPTIISVMAEEYKLSRQGDSPNNGRMTDD